MRVFHRHDRSQQRLYPPEWPLENCAPPCGAASGSRPLRDESGCAIILPRVPLPSPASEDPGGRPPGGTTGSGRAVGNSHAAETPELLLELLELLLPQFLDLRQELVSQPLGLLVELAPVLLNFLPVVCRLPADFRRGAV